MRFFFFTFVVLHLFLFYGTSASGDLEILNDEFFLCLSSLTLRWQGGQPPYELNFEFRPESGSRQDESQSVGDDTSFLINFPQGTSDLDCTISDANGDQDFKPFSLQGSKSGGSRLCDDLPDQNSSPSTSSVTNTVAATSSSTKDAPSASNSDTSSILSRNTAATSTSTTSSSSFSPGTTRTGDQASSTSNSGTTTTSVSGPQDSSSENHSKPIGAIIGGTVGGIVLLLGLAGLWLYRRREKRTRIFKVDSFYAVPVPQDETETFSPSSGEAEATSSEGDVEDVSAVPSSEGKQSRGQDERVESLQAQVNRLMLENTRLVETLNPQLPPPPYYPR